MVEIQDELVFRRPDRAHRVGHRDLVELMRAEHGVPALGALVPDDGQERSAFELVFRAGRPGPVEDRRHQVDVADKLLAGAALRQAGTGDDERQVDAGIVKRRLRSWKGNAVIADEDDQRLALPARFPAARRGSGPTPRSMRGDRLVVFGQVLANRRAIGEMVGDHDRFRIVLHFPGIAGEGLVAEALLGAVRVLIGDDKEERLLVAVLDELARQLSEVVDVAPLRLGQQAIEAKRGIRPDMKLADQAAEVTGAAQQVRQALPPGMALLAVRRMLQAILAALVRIQAGIDAGPARTARRDRGVCLRETSGAFGQAVEVRRPDDRIAVAAELHAQIVGDDEHDIFRLRLRLCRGRGEPAT